MVFLEITLLLQRREAQGQGSWTQDNSDNSHLSQQRWYRIGDNDIIKQDKYGNFKHLEIEISSIGYHVTVTNRHYYTDINDNGHVSVYNYNSISNLWEELGQDLDSDYDIPGNSVDDIDHMFYGGSVGMNRYGTRVVIGAASMLHGGSYYGHVRIFDWNMLHHHWDQIGIDIDPTTTDTNNSNLNSNDNEQYFGSDVAMNADGTRIAIVFNQNEYNTQEATTHIRIVDLK